MTAANHDRSDRMRRQPFARGVNGAADEPRAGKIITIPRERRAMIRDQGGFALFGHGILRERFEIKWQQREPMSVMAKQIAFEKNFGDVPRAIFRKARRREE